MSDIKIISIELTNQCDKACWFCYNHSAPSGDTAWTADQLIGFTSDCADHGVEAVSWGGGEPLQFPELLHVVSSLRGKLFQSMTTNGLHLTRDWLDELASAGLAKLHLSIHFPERPDEVERVIDQLRMVETAGLRGGINFLVQRSRLAEAEQAAKRLAQSGIGPDQIIYLPMRISDTPTPKEMARVAGGRRFQSMSCLTECAVSPRFASIDWKKQAAFCSYTESRRTLGELNHKGLMDSLNGLAGC